jgi:long-chain acyl-CoA synthetase
MNHNTSADTLAKYVLKLAKRKQVNCLNVLEKNGTTKTYSSQSYFDQIQKVSKALCDSGIKKSDKIAIFSNTRHEWSVCDLASICIGAVVVPLYSNMTTEELSYILNHSDCKMIFVENRTALRQLMVIREQCPQLKTVVLFDPPQQKEVGVWISFSEFIAGAVQGTRQSFNFERLCVQAMPDDIVTIIYTSGTTGVPKGVVLKNSQILFEIQEVFAALQITAEDHTLSFLPYSHVLGRIEHWGHLVIGYSMTYSAGMERLATELQLVQPTVMVAVPRVFEKLYIGLKTKIETSSIDSTIFSWAFGVGSEVSQKRQRHEELGLKLSAQFQLAKSLLFDRLKEQLFGSNLRFAISGGAPLNSDIIRFFHTCGIQILEGYGLTETTGAICLNRPYDFEFGTIGKPLHKVKIKIAKDGEILVQSPTSMVEYYKNPESTARVMQDGWLHTGDIGEINSSGRLLLKDRKKDLIKTANGKYVAPQKIEGMFKQLPFISHAHIHGDQRSYVVALLTLNKNFLFAQAREREIPFKSLEDLKDHPFIKEMIRNGVAQINSNLASHESIKNYAVLSEDFSIESGEITPTLKVKRRIVDQKYKTLIDSLYD